MVTSPQRFTRRQGAFASMDLFLAMAVFLVGFFSVAYVSSREMRLARAYYFDAIAMSLVDGELEVLAAGEWQSLPEGTTGYLSKAPAVDSLPPGEFRATRTNDFIRLEWIPAGRANGRHITREFRLKGSASTTDPTSP